LPHLVKTEHADIYLVKLNILMDFRQYLEANEPWFFAKRPLPMSRPDATAEAIYKLLSRTQLRFFIDESIDEIIEDLKRDGESANLNIRSLVEENAPYYMDTDPDEPKSIPRPWVEKLHNFIDHSIGSDPKIKELINSKEFIDQLPQWERHLPSQMSQQTKNSISSTVFSYAEREMAHLLRKRVIQEFRTADFNVNIFGKKQAYGGPEEGGWYYTHKDLLKQMRGKIVETFRGRDAAIGTDPDSDRLGFSTTIPVDEVPESEIDRRWSGRLGDEVGVCLRGLCGGAPA